MSPCPIRPSIGTVSSCDDIHSNMFLRVTVFANVVVRSVRVMPSGNTFVTCVVVAITSESGAERAIDVAHVIRHRRAYLRRFTTAGLPDDHVCQAPSWP